MAFIGLGILNPHLPNIETLNYLLSQCSAETNERYRGYIDEFLERHQLHEEDLEGVFQFYRFTSDLDNLRIADPIELYQEFVLNKYGVRLDFTGNALLLVYKPPFNYNGAEKELTDAKLREIFADIQQYAYLPQEVVERVSE